jgi:hypothetical protein
MGRVRTPLKTILLYLGGYLAVAGVILIFVAGCAHYEFGFYGFDGPASIAFLILFLVWIGWQLTDAIQRRQVHYFLLAWAAVIFLPGILLYFFGLLGPLGRLLYLFFVPPELRD